MIWNTLVNFLCNVFDNMISYVPDVTYSIPNGAIDGLKTLCKNIGYVLPITDLLVVFDLWVAYMSFRLGVQFYKNRIKIH